MWTRSLPLKMDPETKILGNGPHFLRVTRRLQGFSAGLWAAHPGCQTSRLEAQLPTRCQALASRCYVPCRPLARLPGGPRESEASEVRQAWNPCEQSNRQKLIFPSRWSHVACLVSTAPAKNVPLPGLWFTHPVEDRGRPPCACPAGGFGSIPPRSCQGMAPSRRGLDPRGRGGGGPRWLLCIWQVRPPQPTPQQIAEHNLTHLPYRNWCPICVQGKGRQDNYKKQQSRQLGVSRVFLVLAWSLKLVEGVLIMCTPLRCQCDQSIDANGTFKQRQASFERGNSKLTPPPKKKKKEK